MFSNYEHFADPDTCLGWDQQVSDTRSELWDDLSWQILGVSSVTREQGASDGLRQHRRPECLDWLPRPKPVSCVSSNMPSPCQSRERTVSRVDGCVTLIPWCKGGIIIVELGQMLRLGLRRGCLSRLGRARIRHTQASPAQTRPHQSSCSHKYPEYVLQYLGGGKLATNL